MDDIKFRILYMSNSIIIIMDWLMGFLKKICFQHNLIISPLQIEMVVWKPFLKFEFPWSGCYSPLLTIMAIMVI